MTKAKKSDCSFFVGHFQKQRKEIDVIKVKQKGQNDRASYYTAADFILVLHPQLSIMTKMLFILESNCSKTPKQNSI